MQTEVMWLFSSCFVLVCTLTVHSQLVSRYVMLTMSETENIGMLKRCAKKYTCCIEGTKTWKTGKNQINE